MHASSDGLISDDTVTGIASTLGVYHDFGVGDESSYVPCRPGRYSAVLQLLQYWTTPRAISRYGWLGVLLRAMGTYNPRPCDDNNATLYPAPRRLTCQPLLMR